MAQAESTTAGSIKKFSPLKIFDAVNFLIVAACAVVALSAYGDILVNNRFSTMRRESPIYFFDFCKYYICGKMAASEDRLNVYDEAVQKRYLENVAGAARDRPVEYIQYPPIDFPMMMPLAHFPINQAFTVFTLVSLLLAMLGTRALGAQLPEKKSAMQMSLELGLLWFGVLASLPLFRAFSLGQTSLFSLAMAATYFAAILGGSQILGGVALALTAIKPQYTVYFAVAALARGRFKLLAAALAAEMLLLGLAAQTIGVENVLNYPHIVLNADQSENLGGVFASQMVNLRAVFCAFMSERTAMKLSSICTLTSLLLLFFLWRRGRQEDTGKLAVLTVFICLATSPHTHLYDCLLLAIPALILSPFSLTDILRRSTALRLISLLLYVYPALGWALIYWPSGAEARATLPFAAVNLLLAGLALQAVAALPARVCENKASKQGQASSEALSDN